MAIPKHTILWVDNDRMAIQPYIHVLRDAGYDVIVETTVGDAKLRISSEPRIDLALLDVMIPPGVDDQDLDETHAGYQAGVALGRWIKEHRPNLPFVGVSIRFDQEIADWFQEHGAGYASKFSLRHGKDVLEFVAARLNRSTSNKEGEELRPPAQLPTAKKEVLDELQLKLKELEYEYELARMGMLKSRGTMVLAIIGVLSTVIMSFVVRWRSDREFLSGTHIVLIVVIVAFSLVIFSSFIFGRAARLRATISKTKKEIEMVAGEKVR